MSSVFSRLRIIIYKLIIVSSAGLLLMVTPAPVYVFADTTSTSPTNPAQTITSSSGSSPTPQPSSPSTASPSTSDTASSNATPATTAAITPSTTTPVAVSTTKAPTTATMTTTPSVTPPSQTIPVTSSSPSLLTAPEHSSTPTDQCNLSNVPGTTAPTGSAAGTFHLNPTSCLYENDYYTWNPYTKVYTPKTTLVYTYNDSTSMWDVPEWIFNPAKGAYEQATISVSQPPVGAITVGGPKSTSGIMGNNNNSITVSNLTSASVINLLNSVAATGNASVLDNTFGGSAASGNATALANVLNLLQSSSSLANAATFEANVNGAVQGDLLIDPGALQAASSATTLSSVNNIQVNNATTGSLYNGINLAAQSGNATVADNTNAGNATSGNAETIANVVNMINSMIAAKQSFLGVININGNLDGNILMPQQFLDALLASNAPRTTVNLSNTNNATLTNANATDIQNNINASAQSGAATVSGNTNAGSATTGSASTNVTIFDLTGEQIVGANTLLVFVNVMGTWVGMLMNAPSGATAAAYGGNVSATNTNNADITNTNSNAITNDLNLKARSGDATVADNTNAGNATSGSAHTAVNLANIVNDQFSLSNWFGILFINVFGDWTGNFGVFNPSAPPSLAGNTADIGGRAAGKVFGFVATPTSSKPKHTPLFFSAYSGYRGSATLSAQTTPSTPSKTATLPTPTLLVSKVNKVLGAAAARLTPAAQTTKNVPVRMILAVGLVMAGVGLLGLERYLKYHGRM